MTPSSHNTVETSISLPKCLSWQRPKRSSPRWASGALTTSAAPTRGIKMLLFTKLANVKRRLADYQQLRMTADDRDRKDRAGGRGGAYRQ